MSHVPLAEDGGLPWLEPGWRVAATEWIMERLGERDLDVTGEVEQPHVYPWSTVLRVPTAVGDVWFKATVGSSRFEAPLTDLLARLRPELVPPVLAADAGRGWLMLGDGGTRLRELVRSTADLHHWTALLPAYAELQIDVAARADELLALGVPDARLAGVPAALGRLLDEPDLLIGSGPDALTSSEHDRLETLVPAFGDMCRELAAYGMPETLQHDDLHEGNVFVREGQYVVVDWGDSCVSHPFHTLVVTLRALAWKLGIEPGAPALERLRDAYLEPWSRFAAPPELRSAFALAYRTGTVCRALAWHRYATAPDVRLSQEDADAVPYGLKLFLAAGPIGSWQP